MTVELIYGWFALVAFYFIISLAVIVSAERSSKATIIRTDIINYSFVVILSILAFFTKNVVPGRYNDMVRIKNELYYANIQGVSLLYSKYSGSPLSGALLSIGYYTHDARWISVVSTVIVYTSLFLCGSLLIRRRQIDPRCMLIGNVVMLLQMNYIYVVVNVRFWVALACVLLALALLELTSMKLMPLILMVFGILTHMGVLVISVIYFFSKIFRQKFYFVFCIFMISYSFLTKFTAAIFTDSKITFLEKLSGKIGDYFGFSADYQNSYDANQPLNAWLAITLCLAAAIVIYLISNPMESNEKLKNSFQKFVLAMLLFTIGSIRSYSIYERYTMISVLLIIPMVVEELPGYFTMKSSIKNNMAGRAEATSRVLSFTTLMLLVLLLIKMRLTSFEGFAFVF